MPQFFTDCPRCGIKNTTFDLLSFNMLRNSDFAGGGEVFSVCRSCHRSTVFIFVPRKISVEDAFSDRYNFHMAVLNEHLSLAGRVSLKDMATANPPEHIPEDIKKAFQEGATCLSVKCHNASVAMFRLCLDLATKPLLPEGNTPGLSDQTRRNLGLRLPWLFNNGKLPESYRELSACIKDNGNDGAHEGTVTEHDAIDVCEFTFALLERLYTEPKKIELSKKRREERRSGK